jgi:hypothetical protein
VQPRLKIRQGELRHRSALGAASTSPSRSLHATYVVDARDLLRDESASVAPEVSWPTIGRPNDHAARQ